MPPKAKFTKEEIIEKAVQITRRDGIEAITARELGKELSSSARPIFTVFQNMDEVRFEVINYAKAIYKQYLKKGLEQEIAFRGVGIAYITYAMKEPKLFQLLFMREQDGSKDIHNILTIIDENYEEILKSVQEPYKLTLSDAKKLYQHLWIYTHGIATLCANNVCRFTGEEIGQMLTEVFISLLKEIKQGEKA